MNLKQRIHAFTELGNFLSQIANRYEDYLKNPSSFDDEIEILQRAESQNGWFTPENIIYSLRSWSDALTQDKLQKWTAAYNFNEEKSITVGVVMAGNIPLVGFHDFLSVLISGNAIKIKLSSNDQILLPFLADFLIKQNEDFENKISFVKEKLEDFDAVIATGSNNTARYFDYYFGKYPNIIRHNRNSVAVLTGEETKEELEALSDDIFLYFGLGCRNVSKLFVPKNYDFTAFFEACFKWKDTIHNNKYINNYDYNKAVYLMDNLSLRDNGFLILKEDSGFSSPIGVLFYEYYDNPEALKDFLSQNRDQIQAVVSSQLFDTDVPFGKAQKPDLTDYADSVDTLRFLTGLVS